MTASTYPVSRPVEVRTVPGRPYDPVYPGSVPGGIIVLQGNLHRTAYPGARPVENPTG